MKELNLTLDDLIKRSKMLIIEFYEQFGGEVYCATSGGKDSLVLLDLIRSIYPDVEAFHVDTGQEFKSLRKMVRTIDNCTIYRPKTSHKKVLEIYGYPIVSKQVAMAIDRFRRTKRDEIRLFRKWGIRIKGVSDSYCKGVLDLLNKGEKITDIIKRFHIDKSTVTKGSVGTIPLKWHYLLNAPFKISERCCDILKKEPYKRFERKTGKKAIVGVMAVDSHGRRMSYNNDGCNAFKLKRPQSRPLMFWTAKNIWEYIRKFDLKYPEVYDMGVKNTGCMFCGFGAHLEKEDRFKTLKKINPKAYNYYHNKLGFKNVLTWYLDKDNINNSPEIKIIVGGIKILEV